MTRKSMSLMTGELKPVDADADPVDANGDSGAAVAGNGTKGSDPKPKIDFLKDDVYEMTYSRRIALKLMKYSWYYPKSDDEEEEGSEDAKKSVVEDGDDDSVVDDFDEDITFEKPNLEKGWAFFEHQALYRYILPENYKEKPKYGFLKTCFRTLFMHRNKKFEKAEPGEDEDPSRLYPVFTPHNQLGDFGLGIGLYFSALRALILISLICGFISMGNILYFASDTYDSCNADEHLSFTSVPLKFGASCSDQDWVPCPDCDCTGHRFRSDGLSAHRCAVATNAAGEELKFGLKNNCDGTPWFLAASNFATVVFMVLSTFALGLYMRREEVKFDEDEQTAQDYSILIRDPPEDANDPEEWRSFFKKNFDGAKVIACTCAVENDLLVKALVQRREIIRTIHDLQPGKSMEMLEIAKNAAEIQRGRKLHQRLLAKVVPGIPELYEQLVCLKGRVEGLAQLNYPVKNVFITFDTEEDQRRVLDELSVGCKTATMNDTSALSDTKYLFRGDHVLEILEAEEPSAIRWENLNCPLIKTLKQQLTTLVLTLLGLAFVFWIIWRVNQDKPVWAAYLISIFNSIFPLFAKGMTNYLETHPSESGKQASLFFKIALFRWVTTALIWYIIIPFVNITAYGRDGLIERVYLQFFSDITWGNLLPLLDIVGQLKRHVLAPRATTQDKMDNCFAGTPYNLAERYTDMTKILFLCLFYSSIFPMSFFLCAFSLLLKYFVDRFNLVRSWKRAPALGTTISSISRRYVITMAVGIMAIVCSYYWTGFPFDNLCLDEDSPVSASYVGNFSVSPLPKDRWFNGTLSTTVTDATVTEDDFNYKFCSMDFTGYFPSRSFPFVPTRGSGILDPYAYMTDEQIISTTYFGWSAFAFMLVILFKWFWGFYVWFRTIYIGGFTPVGESQGIPFSQCESRCAYIPQVHSCEFSFPLIACKIDDIDEEMFDFKDPSRSYKYYDLTVDAKKLTSARNAKNAVDTDDGGDPLAFTIVKTWPAENAD